MARGQAHPELLWSWSHSTGMLTFILPPAGACIQHRVGADCLLYFPSQPVTYLDLDTAPKLKIPGDNNTVKITATFPFGCVLFVCLFQVLGFLLWICTLFSGVFLLFCFVLFSLSSFLLYQFTGDYRIFLNPSLIVISFPFFLSTSFPLFPFNFSPLNFFSYFYSSYNFWGFSLYLLFLISFFSYLCVSI